MNKDVIIIGAGAAGMMCAISAGARGRRVLLVDHSRTLAGKIRISGGGRCNFTNQNIGAENYISENPHFCRSALSRFTPQDILGYLQKHNIDWQERKLGQLFLKNTSRDIIDMLRQECLETGGQFLTGEDVLDIHHEAGKKDRLFTVLTKTKSVSAPSLVIATGGLSVPAQGRLLKGKERT